LETGGILVGYVANNAETVISLVIGPGPGASHLPHRFSPDHLWQCQQLDLVYGKSSGSLVYVGDWHTHPDASIKMSPLDSRTLRAIAKHKGALLPEPLMVIGGGRPGAWSWAGYRYRGDRLLGLMVDVTRPTLCLF